MSKKTTKDRVKLINCTEEILNAIIKGDEALAELLKVQVLENWSEFGSPAFEYSLEKIKKNPQDVKWWTYLPIHVWKNAVIGSCGYKGPPDSEGMVELGYEVIAQYRNRGYAREITHILINEAFKDDSVKKVRAHTEATSNPSASLLEKCGFKNIGEVQDEDDGSLWRWERIRDDSGKK